MPHEPVAEQPLDPRVLEQAAEWLIRLGDRNASAKDHAACVRWCAQNPEHARAWERAQRLQALLSSLPPELALPVLGRAPDLQRRKVMKKLTLLAAAAVPGTWAGYALWQASGTGDRLRTAIAERRRITLPDGGQLDLEADTEVRLDYGPGLRLLQLRRGRIAIETAHDTTQPARPFLVKTASATLQALGTRFDVTVTPSGEGRLIVLEGAVRLLPLHNATASRVLHANEAARFDAFAVHAAVPAHAHELAWRDGMITADGMPLGELLQTLSRYHHGVLRWPRQVASLRVSGAFPLDDPERSLALLEAACPVQVRRRLGGWWVEVEPRPAHPPPAG